MKHVLLVLLVVFFLPCAALALEAIPQDVLALCDGEYPGHTILASDGYDDGATGQWALVLTKGGDNALIIAERTGGGSYALTVSNPAAVPDEGEGYSRETHTIRVKLSKHYKTYDRLGAFELAIEQPGYSKWVITSELQDDGRTWGNIISDYTLFEWGGRTVWWSHLFAEDGTLNYMRHQEDLQGKPLSTTSYPRISVGGESAQMHLLDHFDAGAYPYMPDLIYGERLSDYAAELVPHEYTLVQMDLQEHSLILLVESPQGVRTLRILPHENWQFKGAIVTGQLPGNASLDLFHADEGTLQLEWYDGKRDFQFGFTQSRLEQWTPAWLQVDSDTDSSCYYFTYNSVVCTEDLTEPMRNNSVCYGDHPWQMIEEIDFGELPLTKEAMLATVDQSAYAVVNNPNPEDRLHLRERPRTDARSFGKFYNRTPVRVHSIDGEWANVSVGSITGYMMVKYLAFGAEMESVKCAFPQMFIREGVEKVALRPYREGRNPGMLDRETAFYIVGVEEDRYVILTEEGTTGYLNQSYFYPGNG